MPPRVENNPQLIKQWVEDKQTLEVELGWELLEVFNTTPSLIGPIRERASAAASELLQAYFGPDDNLRYALTLAWSKEHTAVAGAPGGVPGPLRDFLTRYPSLLAMFNGALNMDAQDCSMLIRLYGGFVEQAAIHARGSLYDWLAQRKLEYRRGFLDLPVMTAVELESAGIEQPGHWANLMQRLRRRTGPAGLSWLVDIWNAPQGFIRYSGGGISGFELYTHDTVLKIDRVFGLMPGASISGTTTDLMFFMDMFSTGDWDPIYYLLACADFVARGHHTIVETALPLALNGYIDYSIGFYTSLMPTGHRPGKPATSHGAQGAVWNALDKAEHDPRNRLMLVYYDRARQWYEGCYVFDRTDSKFRLLATADDNMLATFSAHFLDQWATHQQVFNWMKLYYPV
ncbi:MAG: hypothetical protein ACYTBJ_02590 [Planctomycetota bacterium]|jgi:hypothetical protein